MTIRKYLFMSLLFGLFATLSATGADVLQVASFSTVLTEIAQQVGTSFNPNFAGALGVILLLVSLAIVVAYNRILTRLSGEQGMA